MPESDDDIRERAYFLWLNDGQPHDRHVDHWLQAESDVRAGDAVQPETAAAPADP